MVAGAGFVGSGSGSGRRSPGRLGRSVHRPQPIAAIGLVVGLLVVIGVVVKVFDLKQKRESEAVQLQAQLSDALLREPSLAGLPLTPTVHVPMWRGTPATIELMGRVPTPELKDTVLRIVRDEAARIRSDVQIEDRLSVVPTMARVA